jgi:hypothetical protein
LVFTQHAVDAMLDDGESQESVSEAICRATSFGQQADGTWRVHGQDLTAVVAVRANVIVVTVFV